MISWEIWLAPLALLVLALLEGRRRLRLARKKDREMWEHIKRRLEDTDIWN